MAAFQRYRRFRYFALLVILLLAAYLIPVLSDFRAFSVRSFTHDQDGLNMAWERSAAIAFLSNFINIFLSLVIAIALREIPFYSGKGKWLALLLLPVLLGNVSVAFTGRLLFTSSHFFQSGFLTKLSTLLAIEFWQFGTLYIYLFWLVIQNIPRSVVNYGDSVKLTVWESARDIFLPACRNLAVLLFILNFIFTFYEDSKIQMVFKSSRGTDTELISQWLSRNYQSVSLINQKLAISQTLQISCIILLLATIMISVSSMAFNRAYKKLTAMRFPIPASIRLKIKNTLWFVMIATVVSPVIYTLSTTFFSLQIDLLPLAFPFLITAVAAILATTFSIGISIIFRLGWKNLLTGFNNDSVGFFIGLFLLQLLPPLILLICGFQWLKMTGYAGELNVDLIWISGHVILTLPILCSFITVTHFRTLKRELEFLNSYELTFMEVIKTAFTRRFTADYSLCFLIAFTLIWNESIISNILSDFIPSFVSNLKMTIEGRAVDFSKGVSYLLISVIIAAGALGAWFSILNKVTRQNAIDNF